MTAIAVFLMPLVLLAYERGRIGLGRPRRRFARLLAAAVAGRDAGADRRRRRGLALLARARAPAAAAPSRSARPSGSRPLYYFAAQPPRPRLGARRRGQRRRRDAGVELAVVGDRADPRAARGPRRARLPDARRRRGRTSRVRVWPFAALAVYLLPLGTFPYHAFQGLALPLSILAVQGLRTRLAATRARSSSPASCALMTVPGHRAQGRGLAALDPLRRRPVLGLRRTRSRALKAIEADPRPGRRPRPRLRGLHAPVPDRARDLGRRLQLDAGLEAAPEARRRPRRRARSAARRRARLVLRSRARFVFVDCRPGPRRPRARARARSSSARSASAARRSTRCATARRWRGPPAAPTPEG